MAASAADRERDAVVPLARCAGPVDRREVPEAIQADGQAPSATLQPLPLGRAA
jgi:hypothetical protein